jgi:hypothetical protein
MKRVHVKETLSIGWENLPRELHLHIVKSLGLKGVSLFAQLRKEYYEETRALLEAYREAFSTDCHATYSIWFEANLRGNTSEKLQHLHSYGGAIRLFDHGAHTRPRVETFIIRHETAPRRTSIFAKPSLAMLASGSPVVGLLRSTVADLKELVRSRMRPWGDTEPPLHVVLDDIFDEHCLFEGKPTWKWASVNWSGCGGL